ncbi:MOSC domain-containing protein [Fredinandcohnia sp. QZ13]|uniref:MOSC domain-containing protein n=1 Tax=Fredinandcohnia sp. QZ13 TaxID=3073144 RepID=UPI0028535234|nr:MOSC domain-containing protein [Fredinandcohnia sp. QZ13]MDR4889858.1 MOSC domain-containing protein [Fredinandcohnia sp. QZ13]
MTIEIKNFSIGLPKKMTYGKNEEIITAIRKQAVEEAFLTKDGFRGDGVADLKHHGGPDRAVCVYPFEHYSLWESEFLVQFPLPTFGENLTLTNMEEKDVCIGDIYQIGDAVIQITQGRIPCSTITKRTNNPYLLKMMVQTGFTGYLARVLNEGMVRMDSTISLVERNSKQVSILEANEIYYKKPRDIEGIQTILGVEELAVEWKEMLHERLTRLEASH